MGVDCSQKDLNMRDRTKYRNYTGQFANYLEKLWHGRMRLLLPRIQVQKLSQPRTHLIGCII